MSALGKSQTPQIRGLRQPRFSLAEDDVDNHSNSDESQDEGRDQNQEEQPVAQRH